MPIHGPGPPEPVRFATMRHRWEQLTFLHWPYAVDVVQRLLPPGLEVEPWEGCAWVGLVPFRMRLGAPAGPMLSTFPETNVRTYVVGPDGRAGVWFFSLDAGSLLAVTAARAALGLPYQWARMSVAGGSGQLRYCSTGRRRGRVASSYDITVSPGDDIVAPSEFDNFLTARFMLWSRHFGRLLRVQVEHPPWQLQHGRVEACRDELVPAAGLPGPTGEPVVHYSPGVEVRIGPPRSAAADGYSSSRPQQSKSRPR